MSQPQAEEERLALSSLTIAHMRDKLGEWEGNATQFKQAKSKELKQGIVLEAFFRKFVDPKSGEKTSSASGAPSAPKTSSASVPAKGQTENKKTQIENALNFQADVSSNIVSEVPPLLAKVLVFDQEWLDLILRGEKTLELRKSLVDEKDSMYLAVKDCIYAKCLISDPIEICNLDEFEALMKAHHCTVPPHSFPFMAHRVSKCQKLEPVKFLKLG